MTQQWTLILGEQDALPFMGELVVFKTNMKAFGVTGYPMKTQGVTDLWSPAMDGDVKDRVFFGMVVTGRHDDGMPHLYRLVTPSGGHWPRPLSAALLTREGNSSMNYSHAKGRKGYLNMRLATEAEIKVAAEAVRLDLARPDDCNEKLFQALNVRRLMAA